VIATASASNHHYVRSLGADRVDFWSRDFQLRRRIPVSLLETQNGVSPRIG
jgi:hypothetical protein